jgi:predicted dehydrogenase
MASIRLMLEALFRGKQMRIGIAGIGFMGMIHYLTYQKLRGVKVSALCEADRTRLAGDWRTIKGNFGPQGQMMDLTGIEKYDKLDDLIADPTLDAIDICLPPAFHATTAIKALQAGKHVFSEKPIALTAADANKMVGAAERAGRVLMIGHVLPFFPEYAQARKIIESGRHGRLLGGHFRRVISDPAWLPNYFKPEIIGGPMLDLHVHDAHLIRLLFGMPERVTSQGRMRGEVAEYWNSQCDFADRELVVSATSGIIRQQGRGFLHGFEIHLEKATLAYEFMIVRDQPHVAMPLTVFDNKGNAERPALGDGDPLMAFEAELKEVLKCFKAGRASPILAGDLARDAVVLCNKQTQSMKSGKSVKC